MDSPDLPAALGIGPSAAIKASFRRSAVPPCARLRPSTHRAWPVRLIKTLAWTDDKSSGKQPYRRGLPKELRRRELDRRVPAKSSRADAINRPTHRAPSFFAVTSANRTAWPNPPTEL